jgi:hypothetical protein
MWKRILPKSFKALSIDLASALSSNLSRHLGSAAMRQMSMAENRPINQETTLIYRMKLKDYHIAVHISADRRRG